MKQKLGFHFRRTENIMYQKDGYTLNQPTFMQILEAKVVLSVGRKLVPSCCDIVFDAVHEVGQMCTRLNYRNNDVVWVQLYPAAYCKNQLTESVSE